jgi:hypothetical protein
MLVKTHRDALARTGLHIGQENARRYFSQAAPSIELRLDDLHIQCTLAPEFWHGRPEIQDPRLSEWLEFKVARRTSGRDATQLTLLPAGPDSFVLRPYPESRYDAFGADVSKPRKSHHKRVATQPAPSPLEELSVA